MNGNGFVQGSPGDGLHPPRSPGADSNWQAGTACRHREEDDEINNGDTSHLANVHAAGSSPYPADLTAFKEIKTMGK